MVLIGNSIEDLGSFFNKYDYLKSTYHNPHMQFNFPRFYANSAIVDEIEI